MNMQLSKENDGKMVRWTFQRLSKDGDDRSSLAFFSPFNFYLIITQMYVQKKLLNCGIYSILSYGI